MCTYRQTQQTLLRCSYDTGTSSSFSFARPKTTSKSLNILHPTLGLEITHTQLAASSGTWILSRSIVGAHALHDSSSAPLYLSSPRFSSARKLHTATPPFLCLYRCHSLRGEARRIKCSYSKLKDSCKPAKWSPLKQCRAFALAIRILHIRIFGAGV